MLTFIDSHFVCEYLSVVNQQLYGWARWCWTRGSHSGEIFTKSSLTVNSSINITTTQLATCQMFTAY